MSFKPVKKEAELEQEARVPIWKTVFSDLMTNLMLFFLMLYAMTRLTGTDRRAAESAVAAKFKGGKTIEKNISEEEMASKIKDNVDTKFIKVDEDERKIKLSLASPVLFNSGRAALKPEAKEILEQVSDAIKEAENTIVVEGYTDNVPIHNEKFESNWELSTARALNVVEYLIRQGINPARLMAAGYGEFRPVRPNDTEENRRMNRRIEISVIKKETN